MSTRFRFSLSLFTMLALVPTAGVLLCAPLHFVPQVVMQPDGSVLHCFASGDEYFSWLHDASGFTIVEDPATGYYVYAEKRQGQLLPSSRVAGRDDPSAGGLQPWENVTASQIRAARVQRLAATGGVPVYAPTAGTINSLVIFVRFSGEPEYTDLLSVYTTMFNGSAAGTSSMYNYFQEASYGALSVVSSFFPNPLGGKIKSYQDPHPRTYYTPYDATKVPDGYRTESESTQREGALLKAAVEFVALQVPGSLVIDANNDGYVDNICFVVSGTPTAWSTLLWPHMSWMYLQTSINGKLVRSYNLQLRSALMTEGASVLSHEMTHTLGAPDLYHYTSSAVEPVGNWDLMAANSNPPQHMGAYMKYKYLGWVGSIPLISTPGRYSLQPLTSPSGNCFRIRSPYSSSEFFVVEYRKKTSMFESKLPGQGLLLYRIDGSQTGNADGPPDEVYIYRPDGSAQINGALNKAAMSVESGFTIFDDLSNPRSFLSTGVPGGLRITDVTTIGDSISFTLTWPLAAVVDSAIATIYRSDSIVVDWVAEAQCRNKGFEVQRAAVNSGDAFQTVPDSFVPGDGTIGDSHAFSFVDRTNSGEQYYRLKIIDTSNAVSYSHSSRARNVSGVSAEEVVFASFGLAQNYPNPFNPRTEIRSQMPEVRHVKLVIYDMLGREVATLVDERRAAGIYADTFDASNLASGVYIYRLTAGRFVQAKAMMLVK